MFAFIAELFGLSPQNSSRPARRAVKCRRILTIETLEARENRAGITTSLDQGILHITGSAGHDEAYVSIDTHGDNNLANDTLKVTLKHDGVSETKTFDLYKQTANGLVKQFKSIDFDGQGGSDKLADFTDLVMSAHSGPQGVNDQKWISFSDGELAIKGTGVADNVAVESTLGGIHVWAHNKDGDLDVYKPASHMTPQGVAALITKIKFEGHNGNDHFQNNTWIDTEAYGGQGQDWLYGGSGNDVLDGDKEASGYPKPLAGDVDFLFGGKGNDDLRGDYGDDWMYGGEGDDTLYGFEGNDYLDGSSGNDYMVGNEGKDSLVGGSGDDQMNGGSGDDKLYGQAGFDTMEGGEGNDYLDGGADGDSLEDNYGTNELHGGDGADQLFVGLAAGGSVNYAYGEGGNDMLVSMGGINYLHGGDGHDQLWGAPASAGSKDYLYGEGGDDQIVAGNNNSVLDGGNGDDWMSGGDGNDTVTGGNGNDLLFGGLGSDVLDGGAGNDILIGGSCSGGLAADHVHDTLTGGTGLDKFQKDDNGMGGDYDTVTDYVAGDLKLAFIAWGTWETDVNFQGKGKPLT